MQILGRKNVRKTGKTSFFGVRRLAGTSASTGPEEVWRGERAPRVRPESAGKESRHIRQIWQMQKSGQKNGLGIKNAELAQKSKIFGVF